MSGDDQSANDFQSAKSFQLKLATVRSIYLEHYYAWRLSKMNWWVVTNAQTNLNYWYIV